MKREVPFVIGIVIVLVAALLAFVIISHFSQAPVIEVKTTVQASTTTNPTMKICESNSDCPTGESCYPLPHYLGPGNAPRYCLRSAPP